MQSTISRVVEDDGIFIQQELFIEIEIDPSFKKGYKFHFKLHLHVMGFLVGAVTCKYVVVCDDSELFFDLFPHLAMRATKMTSAFADLFAY